MRRKSVEGARPEDGAPGESRETSHRKPGARVPSASWERPGQPDGPGSRAPDASQEAGQPEEPEDETVGASRQSKPKAVTEETAVGASRKS